MKNKIQVILYQDEYCDTQALLDSLKSLRGSECELNVIILGNSQSPELEENIKELFNNHLAPTKFIELQGRSWYSSVNDCIDDSEYLFFMAGGAKLKANCLEKLIDSLNIHDTAGVNPVLLDKTEEKIFHLGYVADSQMRLHSLYEGISPNNPLTLKERVFQLAHPAAFMARKKDFQNIGGFIPERMQLCFFDYCRRLIRHCGHKIRTEPSAFAVYDNKFSAAAISGLWNSLIMRGKLEPGTLIPDYHKNAIADGLKYEITNWLAETCENAAIWDQDDPWLAWRHSPDPASLLRWLSAMSKSQLTSAFNLVREFPAHLPGQFRYYESLAKRLGDFANEAKLELMNEQIVKWQKSSRLFHYGQLRKGLEALKSASIYDTSLDECSASYDAWLELSPNAQPARMEIGKEWTQIAVVMPVYNPEPAFLQQALDSIKAQTYPNWQLCIADDASPNQEIRNILSTYANNDTRIKCAFRSQNGHICHATNSAIELVTAPWAAFMDHDDLISIDALAEISKAAVENNSLKLIYSDEDHIDCNGVRRSPCFRSSSTMHLRGHMMAYRTVLLRELGGVRPGCEGAQDYDLNLRVMEKISQKETAHIARILYHWRIHEGSTAGSIQCKTYVLEAMRKSMLDEALRGGYTASIAETPVKYIFKALYDIPNGLQMGVLILGNEKDLDSQLKKMLEELHKRYKIKIYFSPLFDLNAGGWIRAYNDSAKRVDSDLILFLSPQLVPMKDCRPEQLLLMCGQPEVAMVGSLIWQKRRLWNGGFYPDVTGFPFPLLKGSTANELNYRSWGEFIFSRQILASPWQCAAVRKEILLDGLDEKMGNFAMADFCLRQMEKGRKILASPWGQWEMRVNRADQMPSAEESRYFLERWGETVSQSGLRNSNLKSGNDHDWELLLSH